MWGHVQKKFLFILLLTMMGGLSACGRETVGDTVSLEKDRERQRLQLITNDYQSINGTYQGVATDGASVTLLVETAKVSKDSSSLPQPSLVGSFIFMPKLALGSADSAAKVIYPFSDGTYDATSGDLAMTINKDGTSSVTHCKVTKGNSGPQSLSCRWYYRAYQEFSLNRQITSPGASGSPLSSLSAQPVKGEYIGEDGDSRIVANIQAAQLSTDNPTGQPLLIGSFTFTPKIQIDGTEDAAIKMIFPFSNGTYDPVTGEIAITIDVEGARFPVSCKVQDESSLRCKWHYRSFKEFTLKRSPMKKEASQSSVKVSIQGTYTGEDAESNITAVIQIAYVNKDGAIVPQPAIVGSFTFSAKQQPPMAVAGGLPPVQETFPFTDGRYEPISGNIAITVGGDGANIVVNCRVPEKGKLVCQWFSKVYEEFTLIKKP